jgi:predicted double-glycine peptidase
MTAPRPILVGIAALALVLTAPAGVQAKAVRSLLELRDQALVRQHWDLSCGAAAVATLLTYQWNDPVTERQAALGMLRAGDARLVRARLGFSLLDLKRFAATRGLQATGYADLSLDELIGMAPAIVPLQARGGGHFVVVRGRRGDRILVGDPAFGNRTLTTDAFLKLWTSRIGFVLFRAADPHPSNRIGAPAELFLAPTDAAVRQSAVETGNARASP